jgi:hypothetical protein
LKRSRSNIPFFRRRSHIECAGRACIFYAPDLIFIHERSAALNSVQLYIGDGATITQSFIRKRGKALIGHSPVRTQLTWCQKEGVPRAIITHCGSEIVTGHERDIADKLDVTAAERDIDVCIAYDGMKVMLRGRAARTGVTRPTKRAIGRAGSPQLARRGVHAETGRHEPR